MWCLGVILWRLTEANLYFYHLKKYKINTNALQVPVVKVHVFFISSQFYYLVLVPLYFYASKSCGMLPCTAYTCKRVYVEKHVALSVCTENVKNRQSPKVRWENVPENVEHVSAFHPNTDVQVAGSRYTKNRVLPSVVFYASTSTRTGRVDWFSYFFLFIVFNEIIVLG
jgi:hypothetical protein